MTVLKSINIVLRFLLEIGALVAVGYWGFNTGNGNVMKILSGVGTPFLVALVWGVFGSPKSIVKLAMPLHLFLEFIVFGIAVAALQASGLPQLAWTYGICVILNRLLMFMWKQ